MVQRYDVDSPSVCFETEGGYFVKYEDYEELERCIRARAITDCKMPPRIENIEAFTQKQVEDMWVHRVRWLCDHLGVRVHE